MTFTTRFAPSPTGPLHLGHAYSALLAHDMAMAQGGAFLLRIEDIDQSRARPHWEDQIYDDLSWLGLRWPTPVMRQSDRLAQYGAALDRLWDMGLLYPCSCSRKDIETAVNAPQEGVPGYGPDGLIYPGTCRTTQMADRPPANPVPRPKGTVLRLDMTKACRMAEASPPSGTSSKHPSQSIAHFQETGSGPKGQTGLINVSIAEMQNKVGDIIVARKDMGTSYHLSVVVDDAAQAITHVTRGQDLFEATKIHVVLQRVLGLPTPIYHHHRLIRDMQGKRLAKRDDARAIAKYRADGASPQDIRHLIGRA